MLARCRAHLAEAGETYFEHLRFASTVGALAIGAGLACMIHALVPCLCETTCSRTVAHLQRLFADRGRLPEIRAEASGVTGFLGLLGVSLFTASYVLLLSSGAALAWVAASPAALLPILYLVQNPALDPIEPAPARLPSERR